MEPTTLNVCCFLLNVKCEGKSLEKEIQRLFSFCDHNFEDISEATWQAQREAALY